MIDFTDCPVDDDFIYGGANGKKIGIRYTGHIYMLKFPPRSHAKYQNGGYANSCISEHLGCQIFKSIGMDAQDTILGHLPTAEGSRRLSSPAETSPKAENASDRSWRSRTPAYPRTTAELVPNWMMCYPLWVNRDMWTRRRP